VLRRRLKKLKPELRLENIKVSGLNQTRLTWLISKTCSAQFILFLTLSKSIYSATKRKSKLLISF